MLKDVAAKHGLIVLTDSDGGGLVIRNHLRALIPPHQLTHLYIPKIEGKEKRKEEASKEGLLGVEGMNIDLLRLLFEPFLEEKVQKSARKVTKTDLFCDGLLGNEGSAEKRKKFCSKCNLPDNISSKALLEAINLLFGYDRYKEIINGIN
jgi:ribonuclease M5